MKPLKFSALVCFFWITFHPISYCQTITITDSTIKNNSWFATVNSGFLLYDGHLKQSDYFPFQKNYPKVASSRDFPGESGVVIGRQISPIIGIEAMLEDGNLMGMNQDLNEYFKANIVTWGLNIKISILPIINPDLKSCKIDVYGIAGVGLCAFKTIVSSISTNHYIYSYGYGLSHQVKRRTHETNIPLGLGIKYRLSKKIDIGVESDFNFVNTRKLDAYNVVNNNATSDKYLYTAVTLSYRFHINTSQVPKSIIYNSSPNNNNAISQKKDTVVIHDYSTVFVKDLSGNNSTTQNQGKNDTTAGKNYTTTPNNTSQNKDTTTGKNVKNTSKTETNQNNTNHNGNTINPAAINGLFFTIQIGTFKDLPDLSLFSKLDDIVVEKVNDKKYRVTCGIIQDMLEANVKLEDLVKKGYKDAFLAAYYKGKRITIAEAKKIYYNK